MKSFPIVFRTKASPTIGFGHLRRCISLAKELRKQESNIYFIINHDQNAVNLLKNNDFEHTTMLANDEKQLTETLALSKKLKAKALILDTYDINNQCLANEKDFIRVVIDDRQDIPFFADLVINPAANTERNNTLSSSSVRFLLGLNYILQDEIFSSVKNRIFDNPIKRILISVGGSDEYALTLQLIHGCREALSGVALDVVMGPFFNEDVKDQIKNLAAASNQIILHDSPSSLYDLMTQCDFAITGGGQTTYELAVTGTPSLAIKVVDNQTCNLKLLSEKGTLIWVGDREDNDLCQKLTQQLLSLSSDVNIRRKMSENGRLAVDGQGAKRVSNAIMELIK